VSQTSATIPTVQPSAPPTSTTRVSFSLSSQAAFSALAVDEESGDEYNYECKEDGILFSASRVSIEDYSNISPTYHNFQYFTSILCCLSSVD
jgi:hypothetical protein